jgi:hypothetical protein
MDICTASIIAIAGMCAALTLYIVAKMEISHRDRIIRRLRQKR